MLGNSELQESSRDHIFKLPIFNIDICFCTETERYWSTNRSQIRKKHLPDEKIYFYLLQTNFTQLGALN